LVGVTVIDVVAFDTEAVYVVVPEANVGLSVPLDRVKFDKVATVDAVTVKVVVAVLLA
jgi:hypothetical protein